MQTRLALALRHKIMLAFVLFLLGSLVFAGITYQRHIVIQRKLKFIEEAGDLRNNILEARRYEKNIFLYGGENNFKEMLRFLALAEKQLQQFHNGWNTEIDAAKLKQSYNLLKKYRQAAVQYSIVNEGSSIRGEYIAVRSLGDQLRNLGTSLTVEIDDLVKKERRRIDELVNNQKRSLFYSIAALTILAVCVAYYLFFLIFRPLSTIQTAAREISMGNIKEIRLSSGAFEIQSLVLVLNRMIRQLERKSEQLVQQEKMAALGTLTSGVAHELNNPLGNIYSSTQILKEELGEIDPEFQKSLLDGIETQVEKARDIVKSLLEFAREREFEVTTVNINELLDNTLKLVSGEIPAEVEIKTDIPSSLEIEADQRRLSQAFLNLIINGVQVMKDTGGVLTIRAFSQPQDQSVVLEVSDTGPGISEEIQGKIFNPFFSTKDVGQGTGLGLYVTYGIIQKHNGQITVSSKLGEGTKFIVKLPQKQPEENRA